MFRSLFVALASLLVPSAIVFPCAIAFAADAFDPRDLVQSQCLDCHSGDQAEAGLDLESLSTDLADPAGFDRWVEVHDRVAAGEMPPADYGTLDSDVQARFVAGVQPWLAETQRRRQREEGRVGARRLTNLQLERTLHDLLGIDVPLAREMPEEPRTGSFSTLAARQGISHYDLEQHLKAVDLALDEAFRRATGDGDERIQSMTAKQISRTRPRTREPEFIDGEAVVWSSRLTFYGRIPATTAKQPGWYRFRFSVASLKQPEEHGVWCTVQSGECVSSAPLMDYVAAFEATEDFREIVVEAWLPKGHMIEIRPNDVTLKQAKFAGGQSANGEGGAQDVPGIRIRDMVVERFHRGQSDEEVRRLLLNDWASVQKDAQGDVTVVADDPRSAGPRLVHAFAERAFRRPIDAADVDRYVELYEAALDAGEPFEAALRTAYRGVLCSPRFMYFQETPGELDCHAVASRLSYLLWGTMPDDELRELADAGRLRDGEVLRAQVRRMLDHPNGERFVKDFAREWLQLGDIGFTEPDRRMYPDFDSIVQEAMLGETHATLQTLLDEDRGVRNFVDSDFTFLNSRLARFYGIEGVEGDSLRQVALSPDSHRGGLLSHGAVLKVTANGTNTSPVLRGVWVSERIMGLHIPPPPDNVPAIEPDIRGATTIREQLALHRDNDQCASCHTKIDPAGFALENFDAAGRWRERYPLLDGKKIKKGPPIDASYVTADGEAFDGFEDFRRIVATCERQLARNFASQLLTYGTGGEITFADRQTLDQIVTESAGSGYGMRSILEAAVLSDIFLSK